MRRLSSLRGFALWGALLLASVAAAQTSPEDLRRALDLHEEVLPLAVKVQDRHGREIEGTIRITSFRPAGAGPFPLVVMNHGRGTPEQRATQPRPRYEHLVRYLVSKGFAVLVPARLGYAETTAVGDPEDAGSCASPQRDAMARAASEQVLATVAFARGLPWIDASRWLVMGQSVGGLAAAAVASRQPPGLMGAVNFSGGAGGLPDKRPGDPCAPERMQELWSTLGASARVPSLWLYWHNDRYWGAEWPPRWADAWQRAGGKVQFHQLPEVGRDGHVGMAADMDHWVPLVEAWLRDLGFARPGLPVRPPPSGHAPLDDVAHLPGGAPTRDLYATRFLKGKPPRAFALGPDGSIGWAVGDWAIGRALGFCQARTGVVCRLYAVDDDVVWVP